jgi:hypothetical protein
MTGNAPTARRGLGSLSTATRQCRSTIALLGKTTSLEAQNEIAGGRTLSASGVCQLRRQDETILPNFICRGDEMLKAPMAYSGLDEIMVGTDA